MKKEYDFEKMKGRKNPYASKLKQQITIKVETDILEYFQNCSKETGQWAKVAVSMIGKVKTTAQVIQI